MKDLLVVQHAKWIARRSNRSLGHYNASAAARAKDKDLIESTSGKVPLHSEVSSVSQQPLVAPPAVVAPMHANLVAAQHVAQLPVSTLAFSLPPKWCMSVCSAYVVLSTCTSIFDLLSISFAVRYVFHLCTFPYLFTSDFL